jgi:RES domain
MLISSWYARSSAATASRVATSPTADPPPPSPPADLPRRPLPIDERPSGTMWWRLHLRVYSPLFFGPPPREPPRGRFDAPDGSFAVCYLGASEEASFAEAFLRVRGGIFDEADLEPRAFSQIENTETLRLVQMHGDGLHKIGATSVIASGPYMASRSWSLALHNHRDRPDGISYRSRHDDGVFCAAIYDRARAKLVTRNTEPMLHELDRLRRLCKRYDAVMTIGGVRLI